MNNQDKSVNTPSGHVDVLIAKLKARFRVQTDSELASALHLGRSAISTWKMRGRVPEKYEQLANGEMLHEFYGETPWKLWNDLEKAGMELALLRMMRDYSGLLVDYTEFLRAGRSIPAALAEYHGNATAELADKVCDINADDARHALNVMVFDEFFKNS